MKILITILLATCLAFPVSASQSNKPTKPPQSIETIDPVFRDITVRGICYKSLDSFKKDLEQYKFEPIMASSTIPSSVKDAKPDLISILYSQQEHVLLIAENLQPGSVCVLIKGFDLYYNDQTLLNLFDGFTEKVNNDSK